MKTLHLIASAILFGTAAVGNAQCPTAPLAAPTPAERLAEAMLSDEVTLRGAAKAVDAGIDKELAAHPLQRDWYIKAGLKNKIWEPLRNETLRGMECRLPELHTNIGSLLLRQMSPEEIQQNIAFMAAPAGQKLMATAFASVDNNPNSTLGTQKKLARTTLAQRLTQTDIEVANAFFASRAGAKFKIAIPLIYDIARTWVVHLQAEVMPYLGRKLVESIKQDKDGLEGSGHE